MHRCAHILAGYTARRALSDAEVAALADFMWAGALACGFYRWREFNISRPESSDETKQAKVSIGTRVVYAWKGCITAREIKVKVPTRT